MTTKDKNHRLTSDYSNTPLPLLCYAPSAGGNMNALTRTLGQRNVNIVSSQVHSPLYCVFAHDIRASGLGPDRKVLSSVSQRSRLKSHAGSSPPPTMRR